MTPRIVTDADNIPYRTAILARMGFFMGDANLVAALYDPHDLTKPCGWYDTVTGTIDGNQGMLAIPLIKDNQPETIILTDSWQDALRAAELGLFSTAVIGDWRDRYGKVFKARKTYVTSLPPATLVNWAFETRQLDRYDFTNSAQTIEALQTAVLIPKTGTEDDTPADLIELPNDHADTIARAFEAYSKVKHRYHSTDGWSIYHDDKYQRVEHDEEIEQYIRDFIANRIKFKGKRRNELGEFVDCILLPDNKHKSKHFIHNVMAWLRDMPGVHLKPSQSAPCSLEGGLDPRTTIALRNTLISIEHNPPRTMPLSEDFYTFNYLPFNYDPKAECPQWHKFLASIFTNVTLSSETQWNEAKQDFEHKYIETPDQLAADILQEWFGYWISGQTHLQKIFSMIGERRSGKGTTARIAQRLIGRPNVATPTLTSLTGEFGLESLLNKTLAIIGDAHLGGKSSSASGAVELLKGISGEDTQQVNRKNKSHVMVRLAVRFLLLANKIQDLRDSSGALASRFNFLRTSTSFLGREDYGLEDKLVKELPGIFNWAIAGYYRLQERGYMLEHPLGLETKDEFEMMSSPYKAYLRECCIEDPKLRVPLESLKISYWSWARENGVNPCSKNKLISEIKSVCGRLKKDRVRLTKDEFIDFQLGTEGRLDFGTDNREYVLFGLGFNEIGLKHGTNWTVGTGFGTA